MMLKRASMRQVWVKRPLAGYAGNAFEAEGHMLEAAVQPMSGTATAQMYGLQPSQMRLMLVPVGCDLGRVSEANRGTEIPQSGMNAEACDPQGGRPQLGDGACVDVAADAEPDFRVVYVAVWARHVVVHLRYIPEGERGADEL